MSLLSIEAEHDDQRRVRIARAGSRPRSTNASTPGSDRGPRHLFLSAYTVGLGAAPSELVAREIAVFITDHALITVRKDTGARSC